MFRWARRISAGMQAFVATVQLYWNWGQAMGLVGAIGLTAWAAWEWATQFGYLPVVLTALVSFTSMLWLIIGVRSLKPNPESVPTKASLISSSKTENTSSRLAKVAFRIAPPSPVSPGKFILSARVEFLTTVREVGCYSRWGPMVHYMSGRSSWVWRDRVLAFEAPIAHETRVEDFAIGEVTQLELERHSGLLFVQCEVTVSAGDKQQVENYYGALIKSDHPVALGQTVKFEIGANANG